MENHLRRRHFYVKPHLAAARTTCGGISVGEQLVTGLRLISRHLSSSRRLAQLHRSARFHGCAGLRRPSRTLQRSYQRVATQRDAEFRTLLALPRPARYISLMGLRGTIIATLDSPALIPSASTMNSLKALLPFAGEFSIRRDEHRDSQSLKRQTDTCAASVCYKTRESLTISLIFDNRKMFVKSKLRIICIIAQNIIYLMYLQCSFLPYKYILLFKETGSGIKTASKALLLYKH